jgi:hypothetical protein
MLLGMSVTRWGAGVLMVTMVACGGTFAICPCSDGGADLVCPTTPPTASAACSQDKLACEYGSNPDPSCNQAFECSGGAWVDRTSGVACPPQSDCPASYASIPATENCSPETLTCAYPEGECICTQSLGGVEKQTPSWDCIPVVSGCPSPRPDLGTACVANSSNQQCDYGQCSGGISMSCQQGVWQQVFAACPV